VDGMRVVAIENVAAFTEKDIERGYGERRSFG
jgi:hypothetical protein